MTTLARSVLELRTDSAPFFADIARAKREAGGLTESFTQAGAGLQHMGGRLSGIGKGLLPVTGAIAGVGAGLFGLVTSAAATGDAMAKTAREAGVSSETFQELSFALGKVAQVSDRDLSTAFGSLTTRLGDAAAGNQTYAAALAQLGFSQAQIASGTIGTEEAFQRLTQAMQDAESPAQAAALAADLLGERSGRRLAGALRESGDQIDTLRQQARDLGLVMSKDATDASERFNDAMTDLKGEFGAVFRDLGTKLIPVFERDLFPVLRNDVIPAIGTLGDRVGDAIRWFRDLPAPVKKIGGILATTFAVAGPILLGLGTFVATVGSIVTALAPVGTALATVGTALAALVTGAAAPFVLVGAAIAGLVIAWRTWGDDITEIVTNTFTAVKTWLVDKFSAIVEGVREKIDAVKGFFSGLFDDVVGNSWIPDLVDGIGSHIGRLDTLLVGKVDTQLGKLTGASGLFGQMAGDVRGTIKGLFGDSAAGETISAFADKGMTHLQDDVIAPWLERITGKFSEWASSLGSMLSGFFSSLGSAIGGFLGGLGGAATIAGLPFVLGPLLGGGVQPVAGRFGIPADFTTSTPGVPGQSGDEGDLAGIPMAAGGLGRVTGPTQFVAGISGPEEFAFSGEGRSFGRFDDAGVLRELGAIRRELTAQARLTPTLVRAQVQLHGAR